MPSIFSPCMCVRIPKFAVFGVLQSFVRGCSVRNHFTMESRSARIGVIKNNLSHSCGKVPVDGIEIYHQKVGSGPKVVLMMPGVFGCGDTDFGPQINGLNKEKFTLVMVAWDPPGTGKSIPPKRSFPIDYLRRDAEYAGNLMDKLGYNKYSLLGWSDGGKTAGILAAMRPQNIERLILWGANSYIREEDSKLLDKFRDISKWSERIRSPLVAQYGTEDLQRLWSENLDMCLELVKEHGGEIFRKDLKFIKAPTLIIHGMKDDIIPLHHAEFVRDNIEQSTLECWDDGKHHLHLRFPKRFNSRVEAFLTTE